MTAPPTSDGTVRRAPRRSRRLVLTGALFAVTASAAAVGLGASPASAAVAAAPSGVTRVVSASGAIDGSCGSGIPSGTPVSTTVQGAVDAAAPGETIYVCAGTYTEAVTVDKEGIDIVGTNWNDPSGGSDASIIQPPASSPAITLGTAATTNVAVKGLTLDGGTHGVLSQATSGSGLTISNNVLQDQTTAGVETRGIDSGLIAGNTVEPAAGGDGIVTKDAAGALNIESNTITMTGPTGVGVSLISTPTANAITSGLQTVGGSPSTGNTITGGGTGVLLQTGDPSSPTAPYINGGNVTFNSVSGSADDGIRVDGGAYNLAINDNEIVDTGASGIRLAGPTSSGLYDIDTVTMYRNTITDAGRDGIEVTGLANYITAGYTDGTGNTITDPARNGITFDGFQIGSDSAQSSRTNSLTQMRVGSNTITGAGGDGVLLDQVDLGAEGAYVWWNTITGNAGNGVTAVDSDWVSTAFNDIKGNGGDGVHYDNVYRVYVYQNDIAGNADDGIELTNKTDAIYAWVNVVNDNGGRGIAFTSPTASASWNDISYNNVADNALLDCQDQSSGAFYNADSATFLANVWYANTGGEDSQPSGLCGPDDLTVTAPQWDGEVGNPYVGQVPPRPPEASVGPVTWSVVNPPPPDPSIPAQPDLPAGLTLNPTTGQITGTPTQPVDDFTIQLKVTDSSGKTGTYVAHITIYPKLTGDDGAVNGETGSPIAPFTPTVTGGNPDTSKTYSVAPGTADDLPPGLSLDPATGQVTGTPTEPGTYTVTFHVTDNSPNMEDSHDSSVPSIELPPNADTYTVTFTIDEGPVIADGTFDPPAQEGNPYVSPAPSATGGDGGPYTWSTTSPLPAGLSLDPSTGVISGTPADGTKGHYPITLTATDGSGNSGSFTATLEVLGVDGSPMANPVVGLATLAALAFGYVGVTNRRRRGAGEAA